MLKVVFTSDPDSDGTVPTIAEEISVSTIILCVGES